MYMLIAALLALVAGPLLHRFTRSNGAPRAAVDGFTFVAMIGLILGHILPEAHAAAGPLALLLAGAGLFGPTILESGVKSIARAAHRTAILLGVVGLLAHNVVDGMALIETDHGDGGRALAWAVILHRIPAGLILWVLLVPERGQRVAASALGVLGLATVAGYVLGERLAASADTVAIGCFQGLVGGALLHVVLHRVRDEGVPSAARRRFAGGLGGLLAIGFVAVILSGLAHPHSHDPSQEGTAHDAAAAPFGRVFLDLALEAAPALLFAFILAGLVQVFLPKATTAWMRRGGALGQSTRGMLFGLPLPICSCGVVPVYRSLVSQGTPLPAALAFLIATPELGLDAILMSWPMLGGDMALIRIGGAVLLALVIGAVVGRLGPLPGPALTIPLESTPRGFAARLNQALRIGTGDLFDSTAPWILLGLFVAALAQPLISEDALAGLSTFAQVPLFALLGLPVYVCASGATPLVAVFLAKGVSPGAALAFLLTGPATNVTTFGLLSRLHGRKLAFSFALGVAVVTIAMGIGVDLAFPDAGNDSAAAHAGHDHAAAQATLLQEIALGLLAALLAASTLRQGARGFVGRVLRWAGDDDVTGHDHDDRKPNDETKSGCCH